MLKDWLNKRALAFTDEARAFGLPAPKGILLLGRAGLRQEPLRQGGLHASGNCRCCASTWAACSAAWSARPKRTCGAPSRVAESVAPAILWVDEIDKAFAGSQGSGATDGGTTARVFGTFLTWLSEKSAPVFVVATANDISQLPPELLRKGRLDEIFFVDLPSRRGAGGDIPDPPRQARARRREDFDLDALAEASQDFSGAEIEEAINSALYDAFYAKEELTTAHVLTALGQTVPLAKTMDEQISRLRTWAEGRARNASVPRDGQKASTARRMEL